MKLKRIKEIALDLQDHRQYFAPNGDELPNDFGAIFIRSGCIYCGEGLSNSHRENCIVKELIELTNAESLYANETNSFNRYCFYCKKVTKFVYCGNCCHHFCSDEEHNRWESDYNEWNGQTYHYPVHGACL